MQGYLGILSRGLAAHDKALVARAESAIDKALGGFPYDLQVAYSVDAAGRWLAAGDTGRARQQLRRADEVIAKAGFEPDALAPSAVALVAAEFRLGDRQSARARLDGLRDAFAARMSEVTDLRRATPLRAMAETYELLGDRARAADCYADALREGSLNPNARPRANDLCLTLVSMARCGFVPDAGMDRTIASIREGLSAPW
jgi:tetratricopeptide (TPR) repeat protein